MNIAMIILLVYLVVVVLPPIFRWIAFGPNPGKLEQRKADRTRDIVNYIFPGTLYPESSYFDPYVEKMVGDVVIAHPGHINYSPEATAALVAKDVRERKYSRVRILTLSLGDRFTAPLARELRDYVASGNFGVWTIDPCPTSEFIAPSYLWLMRIASPVCIIIRLCLGWLAEIPIIPRDGHWNSIAEMEGMVAEMAYGDQPYWTDADVYGVKDDTRVGLGQHRVLDCVKCAIEDDDIFYMPIDIPGTADGEEEGESSAIILERYGRDVWYYNEYGSLCNIGDPATAKGYHKFFEETGLYSEP